MDDDLYLSDWSGSNWTGSYDWTDDFFGEDEIDDGEEAEFEINLEMEEMVEGFREFWQLIENGVSIC